MKIENIKSLKERAKEMLEGDYTNAIGTEELYTIICEWENALSELEKWRKIKQELIKVNKKIYDVEAIEELIEEICNKDKELEKLKKENYTLIEQNARMSERHFKEQEIKDKMIDLLINKLFDLDYEHNFQKVICDYISKAKCDTYEDDKCDICVKEYIRNEVLKDE